MDRDELYAENMSIWHLSPYIYYSVVCSDRIMESASLNIEIDGHIMR